VLPNLEGNLNGIKEMMKVLGQNYSAKEQEILKMKAVQKQ
jgi:hypothetical protein